MSDRFLQLLTAAAMLVGVIAAIHYAQLGLTLSHYDAKAHLVVARRVLDSLTPEYSQIGAVWLPLPHILNLLPVQVDAMYRTGASAVLISILSFGLACYFLGRIILRVTSSRVATAIGVAIFALQPDVLYLQSTPMTEPLLFGLVLLAMNLVYDWVADGADRPPNAAGLALIAACLTRYEAWIVAAALIALSLVALLLRGKPVRSSLAAAGHLAVYPAVAIGGFFFHSWFTTGDWFVTRGFFVPENPAQGHPFEALREVWYGIRMLTGNALVRVSLVGIAAVLVGGLWSGGFRARSRDLPVGSRDLSAGSRDAAVGSRATWLIALALVAFAVLPTYAFSQGHPFRMRYMVALVVPVAVFSGIAVGLMSGIWRVAAALAVAVWLLITVNPLNPNAPMVQEAQWDRPFSLGRHEVTTCLMREYRHEPILASMGSLAHYMQELSREGIGIRDFVHEGNLPYWQEDIEAPKGRVKWILIEERAEGGDVLAARARASSEFLTGFTRLCEGGGVALYKATTEN